MDQPRIPNGMHVDSNRIAAAAVGPQGDGRGIDWVGI